MKLPTLTDVAQRAGVSYATADRVVNQRGRVSERSAEKVREAVAALSYVRNVEAANLSQSRRYRFVFVLPQGQNAFFRKIRSVLEDRAAEAIALRSVIEVRSVPAFDADELSQELTKLTQEAPDGVAVVGLDAEVLVAPLKELSARSVAVVSLVSALPGLPKSSYIGIDNLAAGRTAARLLGLAHGGKPGLVQVFVGSLAARDHSDRIEGFREVLSCDFPQLRLCDVIEERDDADRFEAAVRDAYAARPDITALYSVGAGNRGLSRALSEMDRRPLVAVHELVSHSRAALESGLFDFIIDQRPEEEVDAALRLMRALADGTPPPARQVMLPTIYLRDNLPPDTSKDVHPHA